MSSRSLFLATSLGALTALGACGDANPCVHSGPGDIECLAHASNALHVQALTEGSAACRFSPTVDEASTTLCDITERAAYAGAYRVKSISVFDERADTLRPWGEDQPLGDGAWARAYVEYILETPWSADAPERVVASYRAVSDAVDETGHVEISWPVSLSIGELVGLAPWRPDPAVIAELEARGAWNPDIPRELNYGALFKEQPEGGYNDMGYHLFFWEEPWTLDQIGEAMIEAFASVDRGDELCPLSGTNLYNRVQRWIDDDPESFVVPPENTDPQPPDDLEPLPQPDDNDDAQPSLPGGDAEPRESE